MSKFEKCLYLAMCNLVTICNILKVIKNMQSGNSNETNDFSVSQKIKYVREQT